MITNPLYSTITDAHWADQLKRARATQNVISLQIRAAIKPTVTPPIRNIVPVK